MGIQHPSISQRCTKVWTQADEASFQVSLEILKADIKAAGGLDGWLQSGIEDWLMPPRSCPVRLHRTTRVRATA